MENKDVEKAAIDSCVFDNGIFNPELTPYYVQGFKSGAEWRIRSVWHEVKDGLPEEGKMVLCETLCGVLIGGPGKITGELVRELGIRRWAYVEDLMPGKEVGI